MELGQFSQANPKGKEKGPLLRAKGELPDQGSNLEPSG